MRGSCVATLRIAAAKRAVAPRPVTATSIPGLLKTLQNEWDAQMLESVQVKKHLELARQELSQALYQHDAACRVIARLVRERDEARSSLAGAASYSAAALAAPGAGAYRSNRLGRVHRTRAAQRPWDCLHPTHHALL